MSTTACLAMFAMMSLTSCNKEDVSYNTSEDEILVTADDGKDYDIPCTLCSMEGNTVYVAPGWYHIHEYDANECILGPNQCTHYDRHHYHMYANGTSMPTGTTFGVTTHFGGTIPGTITGGYRTGQLSDLGL